MYKLTYLPLAKKDLLDISDYISEHLKAPKAAMDLIDTLDDSISRLQRFPNSCRIYQPLEPLETEYRVLPVKNYLVFYTVKDDEVEIHRVIYSMRDMGNLIK
jgi:toxin ParE1/3/4